MSIDNQQKYHLDANGNLVPNTPEPKSAEDAASEFSPYLTACGQFAREAFLAGVAWQKEREAKLVEALEFYAGKSNWDYAEYGDTARAALLKYREEK